MLEYKVVLGVLATIIGILGYIPYFRDIFRGKTEPHAFSWLVWALITTIAFAAQVVENAGPGAWVTGLTALACFAIFFLALKRGKRDFPLIDWLCLASSLVALLLWWLTSDPTLSVILVTITDALAFVPTFRKSWHHPHQETAIEYGAASLKFLIALFALEAFTIATTLYPSYLVIANGAFVTMLLVRRAQLR